MMAMMLPVALLVEAACATVMLRDVGTCVPAWPIVRVCTRHTGTSNEPPLAAAAAAACAGVWARH
jgi:hypothetical protein